MADDEPQDPIPQRPANLDIGASARAELGASYRVRKEIMRLESDRFEVCQNHTLTQPPPLALRLFMRGRTRVVHHDGNGRWEIRDPFAENS